MEPKTKINIWYAVLAVLGVLLLNQWLSAMYAPTRVPYSQFLTALEKGRVIEVVITKDSITGKMRPPGQTTGEMTFTTTRVPPDLSKKLAKYKVIFRGKVESTFFRNLMSWVLPAIIFFGLWMFVIRRMNPGGQMMSFGRNKAKVFAEKDVSTRFEDVAGADEAKAEVEELVDFLKNPGLFQNLGGRLPKGVLLVGPPGTGKTLLARAVAGEAGVPFFSISGSDFVEMFVGLGAARVRDLFTQARENAPCIIFIDELDAIGKARGMGAMGGHDEREQTLNQLLVEMDGFDPRVGVIILAATNRPEILDPALLRAGRFDRHILVDKPDLNGREAILKIHAQNVELGPDVDLHVIAQKTPGFSGADLANVINEAALLAARRRKDSVDMADLDEAVDRIIGGLEKKNRVINPQEKRIVAHHESGHAIVAAFTPDAETVHKISIIPRGLAALGYTQQRPTEDRYLMSRRELLGKIDVLLGGRVAEDLIFGDLTTGAHNDLQRATEIARAMVTEYGMGQTLGPATFPRQVRPMFLSPDQNPYGQAEYGQATADKVDEEVKSILEGRQTHVRELLESHRDLLTDLAQTLLEVETVSEEDFQKIIARHGPKRKAGGRRAGAAKDEAGGETKPD